ncbi:MAG: demethoxyubiquinone hydroxylase family protein, partial [Rhodospirillales bacterium]|nr:demethoxyubiquinone hydroxylase family protein [Rhodospirillales bacterium]
MTKSRLRRRPGDPSEKAQFDRIVRVDHAGEYGAQRIYEGQLAVLGCSPLAKTIRHMHEQELHHLKAFDRLVQERRVRPTALFPLWHVAGFVLGAATATMGEKAAMACTAAVEEVIDEHYAKQANCLG